MTETNTITAPGGAFLEYRLDGSVMTIDHTFVPPAARGTGVAAALVEKALETARINNWSVVPECSYVAAYLKRRK